jgi:hypothetical protein
LFHQDAPKWVLSVKASWWLRSKNETGRDKINTETSKGQKSSSNHLDPTTTFVPLWRPKV